MITEDALFSIDRNTGVVRLTQKLDYEVKNLYRIPIRARDNGTEPLRATCTLVVSINIYIYEFLSLIRHSVRMRLGFCILRKQEKLKRKLVKIFQFYDPSRVPPSRRACPGLSKNV